MNTVSTRLMGGLGNMLFQTSTAFAISRRDKKEFICDTSDMIIPHKPYQYYIENIFRKIRFSNEIGDFINVSEKGFNFNQIDNYQNNIRLNGYFQSEKYFKDFRKEILDLFEIDLPTKKYLEEKYQQILKKDTCSLHVRRGDYLHLNDFHPPQTIDYYKKSIEIIGEEKEFLIFSDDLHWCEEELSFIKNKTLIKDNKDFQDLYLMSMCKNNIIANSSFSWWGAWLNTQSDKIVIAPKIWFGEKNAHLLTDDLYCDKWILI